jgi:hypothetical protein
VPSTARLVAASPPAPVFGTPGVVPVVPVVLVLPVVPVVLVVLVLPVVAAGVTVPLVFVVADGLVTVLPVVPVYVWAEANVDPLTSSALATAILPANFAMRSLVITC